jgi:hypothetical protein
MVQGDLAASVRDFLGLGVEGMGKGPTMIPAAVVRATL